jgi:hypothetical protein
VAQSQLPAGAIKMIPEMPALIPTNPGNIAIPDELKKNILEQMNLVAALKHVLVTEQKILEMLWKAKHEEKHQQISVKPSHTRIVGPCSPCKTLSVRTQSTNVTIVSQTLEFKKKENLAKTFETFWSFYEDFEDDEVEIKEELFFNRRSGRRGSKEIQRKKN